MALCLCISTIYDPIEGIFLECLRKILYLYLGSPGLLRGSNKEFLGILFRFNFANKNYCP